MPEYFTKIFKRSLHDMAYNKIYFAKKPNIFNFIKFGQIALVSKKLNEMIKKKHQFCCKKKKIGFWSQAESSITVA
jgi:hypothetical protein